MGGEGRTQHNSSSQHRPRVLVGLVTRLRCKALLTKSAQGQRRSYSFGTGVPRRDVLTVNNSHKFEPPGIGQVQMWGLTRMLVLKTSV